MLFGRRGRRGRSKRGLSLMTVCLAASLYCLATGTTLIDLGGEAVAAVPEATSSSPSTSADGDPAEHGEEQHREEHQGHSDPVAPVILWLVIILAAAKIGGDVFDRVGQPAVLGELLAGVLLGNVLFLFGHEFMTVLREGSTAFDVADQIIAGTDPTQALQAAFPGDSGAVERFLPMVHSGQFFVYEQLGRIIDIFSRIGVIVLLFVVGLESNVAEMMKVGAVSLLVAVVGVIVPFGLGYLVSWWLLPDATIYVHLFVGATLCATSVGITARVFKDLNKLQTKEAKIILGAAVIDDVLGLIILAVVQGVIIAAGAPEGAADGSMAGQVLSIVLISAVFLGGGVVIGIKATPMLTALVAKMRVPGMKLVYCLVFAFLMAWIADYVGLASIVGAFAAGLVLDEVHFKDFSGTPRHLEELIEPIATFLVPVFFMLMGLQVKLENFGDIHILGLAAAITIAALAGKQACSLVVRDPDVSKASIGFGMIPRGEVGLIFAAIGKTLSYHGEPIIDSGTFSAVVIMVILTTLATPPLLKVSMTRGEAKEAAD